MLIYAGIGSRITPENIQLTMASVASQLAESWLLRSGHAEGADWAFEVGVRRYAHQHKIRPNMEIFIPWLGFNAYLDHNQDLPAPKFDNITSIVPTPSEELIRVAAHFHPAWHKCSPAAKFMHMRNVCQIAGQDMLTPVDMVICWTPRGNRGGGTGQALRIAEYLNIPIFDLALPETPQQLDQFVSKKEQELYAERTKKTNSHDHRAGRSSAGQVETVPTGSKSG